MSPKDADGMANRVDPEWTAPSGAVWFGLHCLPATVWSGSTQFAQTWLSETSKNMVIMARVYVCQEPG